MSMLFGAQHVMLAGSVCYALVRSVTLVSSTAAKKYQRIGVKFSKLSNIENFASSRPNL